jgi:hypothetical protein
VAELLAIQRLEVAPVLFDGLEQDEIDEVHHRGLSAIDQMKRSVCLYLQLFSSLSGARIGK